MYGFKLIKFKLDNNSKQPIEKNSKYWSCIDINCLYELSEF